MCGALHGSDERVSTIQDRLAGHVIQPKEVAGVGGQAASGTQPGITPQSCKPVQGPSYQSRKIVKSTRSTSLSLSKSASETLGTFGPVNSPTKIT